MPSSAWDWPSVGLAGTLAVTSIILTLIGSQGCHSSRASASVFLAVAATLAFTLLGFTLTCASYRNWVVESISAPRLGPGQQHPRSRRGMPGLRSSGGVAGLDKWSALTIALVVLPALGPLISHYHHPSQHFKWVAEKQDLQGIADSANFTKNGARTYTTGAYESITMSLGATVTEEGSNSKVIMSNTADVAVDASNRRVIVPSRVRAACMHGEVHAEGVKAVIAQYACNSTDMQQGQKLSCNTSSSGIAGKDSICLSFGNSTAGARPPYQYMTVNLRDSRIECAVNYSLATVNVEWVGKDQGQLRMCRISRIDFLSFDPDQSALNDEDLLGLKNMPMLVLPLANAFVHTVDPGRVKNCNYDAQELFFGSIFAAATVIRSTSDRYDPTRRDPVAKRNEDPVPVRFTSNSMCQRYGWSSLVVFLLVANLLLLLCCTILGSGTPMDNLADLIQSTSDSLFCFWRRPPFNKSVTNHSVHSSDVTMSPLSVPVNQQVPVGPAPHNQQVPVGPAHAVYGVPVGPQQQ